MTPREVRLECLRLAHRHDYPPVSVIERAKEYEAYVAGQAADAVPVKGQVKQEAEKPTRKRGPAAVPESTGE